MSACLLAVGVAVVLARRSARWLAEPLERLRVTAAASHQLRTPVMRSQLLLDSARGSSAGSRPPDRVAVIDEAAQEAQTLRTQLDVTG